MCVSFCLLTRLEPVCGFKLKKKQQRDIQHLSEVQFKRVSKRSRKPISIYALHLIGSVFPHRCLWYSFNTFLTIAMPLSLYFIYLFIFIPYTIEYCHFYDPLFQATIRMMSMTVVCARRQYFKLLNTSDWAVLHASLDFPFHVPLFGGTSSSVESLRILVWRVVWLSFLVAIQ